MPIFKGSTRLSGKETNINLFLPDYAKGVVITAPYTCPSHGLVWFGAGRSHQIVTHGYL